MKFGNTKTHFCIGIAAAALVMLLLTVGVFAAEEHGWVVASGQCGENLTWTLYEDGLLKISGTGEMDDWAFFAYWDQEPTPPWFTYYSQISALQLDYGITTIGWGAFKGCKGISGNLEIPNSVISIGVHAFNGCSGLTGTLTIPDSVTNVENGAFAGCKGFTGDLIIPDSMTTIGNKGYEESTWYVGPFTGCSGLSGSLTIPDSITSIGNDAFSGCTGFTGSLTIGNSVTSIGDSAFSGCRGFTGSLTIPDSVTSIGDRAFSGCSALTTLTIPNSVKSLGNASFSNCSSLTNVTIGNSVSELQHSVFDACKVLSSVYFKGNAPTLGTDVFRLCSENLTLYCYKKYSTSFITYGGKWNGYPLVVLDDAEPTPEVGLRLTGAALDVGSTIRFSASVSAGDTILWSSTDSNVASVENGTVTARSEGTAVIIAAAKSGGTAVSFEVTVNPAPEPAVKGDFDGDGHVTAKDRMILSRYLAGWPAYTIYFEQQ